MVIMKTILESLMNIWIVGGGDLFYNLDAVLEVYPPTKVFNNHASLTHVENTFETLDV